MRGLVGLIGLPGCAALTAAKIVGETAGIGRFRSEACYTRHAGVAPIPVWSGNTAGRVRMSRSGNRQLNCALHRIAVTQIRLDGDGRRYHRKRLMAGDSTTEALRCLKTPPRPRCLPNPENPTRTSCRVDPSSGLP